ncbi:oligosaccharide flippase family protein [Desulfotomaculum copahuensis]|uniref:Uncharacterized protein n=1 Tax=Desulfotomaculum copahuensis TaxID=1838280 RepID=A0A1B7LDS9_9FIRM|nr:oligosaccharide flippase family protein [Desulfotomaculum copahuensis]OAT81213.1 hypothetical protein A6M21_11380 [Desulfotomaculum copahuensis]
MPDIIQEALTKTTKGTFLVLCGGACGALFAFAARMLLVRHISTSDYGLYSLALAATSILSTLALAGLPEGVPRLIAYYRNRDESRVGSLTGFAVLFSLAAGIAAAAAGIAAAGFIARHLFHDPQLAAPLRILCLSLPALNWLGIIPAVYRGFGRADVKAIFQDGLRNILYLLALAFPALLGLGFNAYLYAYPLSLIVTAAGAALFFARRPPEQTAGPIPRQYRLAAGEALGFSLPLFGTGLSFLIINWMDTLLLGYYKNAATVGLYGAAQPPASLLQFFLGAAVFIYMPVAAQLYSHSATDELRRTYALLTKWIFSATIPFLLVMLIFAEALINTLFGPAYLPAAPALRILALGMLVHTLLGPNGAALVALGRPRLSFMDDAIAAVLNLLLNLALIPRWGLTGAATASASALAVTNVLRSWQLYALIKINPFTKTLVKSAVLSLIVLSAAGLFARRINLISIAFPVILIFISPLLQIMIMKITKSIDYEERDIINLLTGRLHRNVERP